MYSDDTFSYFMTVKGNTEEQELVFEELSKAGIINDFLVPFGDKGNIFSSYCSTEDVFAPNQWDEKDMEQHLHSIAVKVPNAVIEIIGQDEDDKSFGFIKRFHGDMYQESRLVTYMPPLVEGGDIPFDQRMPGPTHIPEMHVLCEEHEGKDAIREFTILGVSEDKEQLRRLMNAKIERDDYGLIADNGIFDSRADHFQTEFNEGFVEYYIVPQEVLSREMVDEMLKTKAYDTTFQCPVNLQELLTVLFERAAVAYGIDLNTFDCEQAAIALMNYKPFQAEVKKEHWLYEATIPESAFKGLTRPTIICQDYIDRLLDEDSDLVVSSFPKQTTQETLDSRISGARERQGNQKIDPAVSTIEPKNR